MELEWTVTLVADAPDDRAAIEEDAGRVGEQLEAVVLREMMLAVGDSASCVTDFTIRP